MTPSNIPSVLASPYPGRTYFQQEWLWGSLQASRGDSGTNQPTEPWFYEQARLLGGGSSINGICANRGSPYDYDEWAAIGANGWSWSDVLPVLQEAGERRRLRRAAARQVRAGADPAAPAEGLDRLHARHGEDLRRHGLRHARGPERCLGRRRVPHHVQRRSERHAGQRRTGISLARGAAAIEPDGADRDARSSGWSIAGGRVEAARFTRGNGESFDCHGAPGDRLGRRAAKSGGADAKRHRPGRASVRARHRGAGRSAGRWREPAGASEHRHLRLSASVGAAAVARGASSAGAAALLLQHRGHPARRHACRDRRARRLACGGTAHRHARVLGEQVRTPPAGCGCRRRRTSDPRSTSACCPIRATWRG